MPDISSFTGVSGGADGDETKDAEKRVRGGGLVRRELR